MHGCLNTIHCDTNGPRGSTQQRRSLFRLTIQNDGRLPRVKKRQKENDVKPPLKQLPENIMCLVLETSGPGENRKRVKFCEANHSAKHALIIYNCTVNPFNIWPFSMTDNAPKYCE